MATYARIQRSGLHCKICAGKFRRKSGEYFILAKQQNLIWFGPDPPDKQTPTNWRTAEGQEFIASYEKIATGEKQ